MRVTGSTRRRAIGFLAMTAAPVVLFIPFGSVPAGAQTVAQTFLQVDCLANVSDTILHQAPLAARLIDSGPTVGTGVATLLLLAALGLFLPVTVAPRWR